MKKHLDLFSGIGGFAIACEMAFGGGIEHIFCDNDSFSQAVLKKHWPNSKIYGDIKKLKGKEIGKVDIVTGGFPCQPFSAAGKRGGTEDDRHLWPEMLRVIRETTPRWVIGENVGGLLTWNGGVVLDEVFAGLEAEGYEVWAFVIPACAVGAPHRRDRVWIVAHTNGDIGQRGGSKKDNYSERTKMEQSIESDSIRISTDSASVGSGRGSCKKCGIQKRLMVSGECEGCQVRSEGEGCIGIENATDSNNSRSGTSKSKIKYDGKKNDKKWEYSQSRTCRQSSNVTSNSNTGRIRRHERQGSEEGTTPCYSWSDNWIEVATRLCPVDDGLSNGLARPRGWRNAALKGAGNAIVPQVAAMILKAIKEIE